MIRTINLLIFILASLWVYQASVPHVQAQDIPQPPQATDGGELFIQYRCVRCHTIGRGAFVGPDLKGVADKYTRDQILTWIENPQLIYSSSGKMPVNPGFPPMPPLQVPPEAAGAIADYILSIIPDTSGPDTGTLAGQVVSGSDGTPQPGVEVTVTPYLGDKPGTQQTLTSDAQGAFSFDGLSWDRSYAVSINYKGAEYSTDKMVFNPGEDKKTLNLPVFEPSLSDENIRIEEAHLIVQVLDGAVTVADLSVFNNTGDTIYIGGKELPEGRKESIKYSLPQGAFNISFVHGLDSESVVTTEEGFSDTTSILPGPRRAVFSYNVPNESGNAIIDKTILYPTSSFLLLVMETGDEYTVKGLTKEEPVVINNERFLKWTGSELTPGSEIVIEVKPLSAGGGSYIEGLFRDGDSLKWVALVLLVVIILLGVIYSLVRRAKDGGGVPDKSKGVAEETDLMQRRNALIKEIASLDDRSESGDIGQTEYKELRDKKKGELLEVTRRLRATHKSP